jgi:hypothetical protein
MDFVEKILELISPETRKGLLFLTGATIVALSFLFAAGFIASLPWFEKIMSQVGLPELAGDFIFVIVVYILVVIISSTDTLYYGDPEQNRYARAFQRWFPSKHLATKLGIKIDLAKDLWFDQFNLWANESHVRHQDWQRTLERGYACRFIYDVQVFSGAIFLLSVGWLIVEGVVTRLFEYEMINLEAKLAITVVYGLIWIAFKYLNRTNESHQTGVWRRFNEINQRNCIWIDQNLNLFKGAGQKETKNAAAQEPES